MRILAKSCFTVFISLCSSIPLLAVPRPMEPVDFLSIPVLYEPALSPDGDSIVYVKKTTDWRDNRTIKDLWLWHQSNGESIQLTRGRGGVSKPAWSPTGDAIAFLADTDDSKNEEIYILRLSGGDAERLTHHPTDIKELQWSHDGSAIYYLAPDRKSPRGDIEKGLKNLLTPFDSPRNHHLWRIDTSTGKRKRLTSGDVSFFSFDISRDGNVIVAERSTGPTVEERLQSCVCLMDLNGNNIRVLTDAVHEHFEPKVSPDGSKVLFLANVNQIGEVYFEKNIFILDCENTDKVEQTCPNIPHEVLSATWAADGSAIYFNANLGVHTQLFQLNVDTHEIHQLTEGQHSIKSWHYSRPADSLLLQFYSSQSPGELWLYDPSQSDSPTQATDLYEGIAEEFEIVDERVVRWMASDSTEIEGLLSVPTKTEGAKRFPLVVQIHGGPRKSDRFGKWSWKYYRPVLTGMGYATLTVNHRGSTGYGDDFVRDMVGNYFRNSHQDVLDGVNFVVEQGIADPNRLAIMGWSAGGHMTNKLITTTDRFKAASSGAGAVDWISMYGQSDMRLYRTSWFGGTPWQKDAPLDKYIEQSALKDMWKAETPTLIFVGANDKRVPATQSILLARALQDNGVPSKLYIAPGQQHDWSRPALRLFKINSELEWYERYLNQQEYEWQEMPDE